MRFRIILGQKLIQQYAYNRELPEVFSCADCLIQGEGPIAVIKQKNEPRAFLIGRVIGRRGKSGQLFGLSTTGKEFHQVILTRAIEQCVTELEGRFILIRVKDSGAYEICCDRFGQLDLYYQSVGGGVVFATDLSLLPFRNGKIKYEQAGIAHSLYVYGFRPPKRHTLYEGVRRLGVGDVATWRDNRLGFHQVPPIVLPTQEYNKKDLARYSDMLLDSIAKRSSPKGNIVFLSSGWDSTSLLASLVKIRGKKHVKGVIGRFNFSERTGVNNPFEIKRAQAVADYVGVKLDIVEIDYWRRGPDIVEKIGGFLRSHMLSGMSLFHWAILSEYLAKRTNGEALFSGEISDGAHNLGFSQFLTLFHPVHDFREYSDKMLCYLFGPTFFKSISNGKFKDDLVFNLIKNKFGERLYDEPAKDPAACARQLLSSFFLRDNRFPFWSLRNNKMMTERGRELYSEVLENEYVKQPAQQVTPETLYSWFLHLYNSFHWQGGTVSSLNSVTEHFGLQMNLPFYDSRLHEFLAAMPESWGRGLEIKPTKYPLKWMLENRINYPWHLQVGPHSYLYDVDPNFNHAAEFIFRSAFAPAIRKLLEQRSFEDILSREVFDLDYFHRIVDHYLRGEEIVAERTDLSALCFLSLTGWYGQKAAV